MFNVKNVIAVGAVAVMPMAGAAATIQIDSFITAQSASAPSGGAAFPSTSTAAAPEAIGGSRTITAMGDGSLFPSSFTSVSVGGGLGAVSNSVAVNGSGLFEWGAGGTDLTDGGLNDTFVLEINEVDLNVTFELTVDGVSASSALTSNTGALTFDFGSFGDLTAVNDISLLVTGPTSFDADFSFFGAEDLIANPVAAVPLPAGGLLLGSVLLGAGFMARRKS